MKGPNGRGAPHTEGNGRGAALGSGVVNSGVSSASLAPSESGICRHRALFCPRLRCAPTFVTGLSGLPSASIPVSQGARCDQSNPWYHQTHADYLAPPDLLLPEY